MAKIKLRIDSDACIEDIQKAIDQLLSSSSNEIEFKNVVKIAAALGAKHIDKGKGRASGSAERFQHDSLKKSKHYYEGFFSIHVIHSGKSQVKVRKRDFKRYIFPAFEELIKIKIEG